MNFEPTDIAIVLVSFAACVYCFVLNRRLKALQNTKDGLGATIMAMSKSISAMSSSTQETRSHVGEMAIRLSSLIEEANKTCLRMEALQLTLEGTQQNAVDQVTATQTELGIMMRIILDQSKTRIMEMTTLMQRLRDLTEAAADAPTAALTSAPVRQKAAAYRTG
jgi:regulator of replication initiation timing